VAGQVTTTSEQFPRAEIRMTRAEGATPQSSPKKTKSQSPAPTDKM